MSGPLRILHLGTGFRPLRRGGLVAYVEDLLEEQHRQGNEVVHLFTGRVYPRGRGPRVKRWSREGPTRLEIVNSPLYDHGRQPLLELAEPRLERLVERVVREVAPDVVHIQELCGFPSSILDVAGCSGAPVVMTLQDYFTICPTFKLLHHDGQTCLRHPVGADCVATIAAQPRDPGLLIEATLRHDLEFRRPLRWLSRAHKDRLNTTLVPAIARRAAARDNALASAAAFQRRRDVNVRRLGRADRLIAMSRRVAELHAMLGVDTARLHTMQLTLAHIASLRPRPPRTGGVVTFATLGGGESLAKGAGVLLTAWAALGDAVAAGRARLLLFGHVDEAMRTWALALPGVTVRGGYRPEEQDELLDEVDVGVLPSIWEEAYGFAGMEFLAKGIPVLANRVGGIPEYVREGSTGWLNDACDAPGLTRIMTDIVAEPGQIDRLAASVVAQRNELVLPMADHARALEEVYREAIAAAPGGGRVERPI